MDKINLPENKLREFFQDSINYYNKPSGADLDVRFMILETLFKAFNKPEDILKEDNKTLRKVLKIIVELDQEAKKLIEKNIDSNQPKSSITTNNTTKILENSLTLQQ